jgi:hypothetical protein
LEAGQKCLDARHLKFGEVRRTRKYAATTMNEGNAADGYFSSAYERRRESRCPRMIIDARDARRNSQS